MQCAEKRKCFSRVPLVQELLTAQAITCSDGEQKGCCNDSTVMRETSSQVLLIKYT